MTEEYIADNRVVLKVQGLRYVQKRDRYNGYGDRNSLYLDWGYQGKEGTTEYKSQEELDAMFDKCVEILSAKKRTPNK